MKNEKIFLELLKSLESDRIIFLNRVMKEEKEEEFIKQVEKLAFYVEKIIDDKIRYKVRKFVNTVLTSTIYKAIIIGRKTKKEKLKNLEKRNNEKILAKNLVEKCKKYYKECDLNPIDLIYKDNKILIHNHEPEFYDFWFKLPRNIDIEKYPLSLKAEVLNRKIKNLIHFTQIENLENILLNGIMPVQELKNHKIQFIQNDYDRFDGKLDCVCLSIEYPNKYLLDKFKFSTNRKFCLIFLDAESVLLNNDKKKYYVYCNAARKDAIKWLRDDTLTKDKYFSNIFLENNTDTREKCTYTRCSKELKPYLPTNEQAEILFSGIIPEKYIRKILFENDEDLEFFKNNLKDQNIVSNFNLESNDLFFKNGRDKILWEDR